MINVLESYIYNSIFFLTFCRKCCSSAVCYHFVITQKKVSNQKCNSSEKNDWKVMKPFIFNISILVVGDGRLWIAEFSHWFGRLFYQSTSWWSSQQLKVYGGIFQELVHVPLKFYWRSWKIWLFRPFELERSGTTCSQNVAFTFSAE